jgi:hypothetical protein
MRWGVFVFGVPGAAQHEASRASTPVFAGYGEVVRCRPGTVTHQALGGPGSAVHRSTSLRAAPHPGHEI